MSSAARPLVLAAALAALFFVAAGQPVTASAQPGALHVAATVTYDVQTSGAAAQVRWDVEITNNDPETVNSGSGTVFFYDTISLPVVRGASGAAATDTAGSSLDVTVEDVGAGIVERATVSFGAPLFYGETYSFTMTYQVANVRSEAVVVTPTYAYLPVVAAGDIANVTVNTPSGDPWAVSIEPQQCEAQGNALSCSGSQNGYLAAFVEVSQPSLTSVSNFTVPLKEQNLAVTLEYFQGEEAIAQHHQELITLGLPIIEQVYGFTYQGAPDLTIAQGARNEILGYEGLAGCSIGGCEVKISPTADDYTVLHEIAHLWSGIFEERWLSEGFAQLVEEEAAAQLPGGLVRGERRQRAPATVALQLDDWGYVESVIGASPEEIAIVDAGYDYSLRFLQQVRDEFGIEVLHAVNRNIAGSGTPADSRRFMDVLEEATGRNLDAMFLLWVFPNGSDATLAARRQSRDRVASAQSRLTAANLPTDALTPIQQDIREWDFENALRGLDTVEINLETYVTLTAELQALAAEAAEAGLSIDDTLTERLNRFEFDSVRSDLTRAREAINAYTAAQQKVEEPRGPWEDFGLLGRDPEGELESAGKAFSQGEFETSRDKSESAAEMVEDASSVALRRLLVLGVILAVLAISVGVAIVAGQWGRRQQPD